MRLTLLNADHTGCGFYRILMPAIVLRRRGHDVFTTSRFEFNTITAEPRVPTDLIVVQRPGNKASLSILQVGRLRRIPVVAEFDDLLWNVPGWNPAGAGWRTTKEEAETKAVANLFALKEFLARCDAFTVSTQPLAEEARRLWPKKPIYVLPNCLAIGDWPDVDRQQRWQETGAVTIGWGGSATHRYDLMQITGIPGQVANRHPHARLFLFGGWREAARLLGAGFPEDRIEQVGWKDIFDLPSVIREIDIGLAPLDGHRFNDSKSSLKALEYGACSTPTVATDSVTYRAFVRDGENGFLCRKPRDWLRALEVLLTDHPRRIEMGRKARKAAEARDISAYIGQWEAAYTEIIDRYRREVGPPVQEGVAV